MERIKQLGSNEFGGNSDKRREKKNATTEDRTCDRQVSRLKNLEEKKNTN